MTERRLISLVFCAGLVLLGLEVLAVRVLTPYFGSSSFTVSSVLTVILLGLAMGYRVGGRWARLPLPERSYGWLLVAAGAGVLLVSASQRWVLPRIGYRLPSDWGPLIVALALFSLPSFALGAQSPITVQMWANLRRARGVEQVSGEAAASIFFWSTLGNIAGGLVTGFVLVPRVGVSAIVGAMGVLLAVLGVIVLIHARRTRLAAGASVGLVVLALVGGRDPHPRDLVDIDGQYQRIRIHDGVLNGRPARFLILDRGVQGAHYLEDSQVASAYAEVYRLNASRVGRDVLVIGGGAYEVPLAILRAESSSRLVVVEIEPALPQLAEEYFRLPRSPRLQHVVMDGRRYLEETERSFDMILVDAYASLYATPWHLATREFFLLAAQRLRPGGIVAANFTGDVTRLEGTALGALIRTFRSVFPSARFFATRGVDRAGVQNVLAVSGPCDFGDQPPIWAGGSLRESPDALVLSDEFAPLEHLIATSLLR